MLFLLLKSFERAEEEIQIANGSWGNERESLPEKNKNEVILVRRT